MEFLLDFLWSFLAGGWLMLEVALLILAVLVPVGIVLSFIIALCVKH